MTGQSQILSTADRLASTSGNGTGNLSGMPLATVSLDDRYRLESGVVLLSGTQALVRLVLLQRARDRAAGLDTAGFISGYRGSPLGGLDRALWDAGEALRAANIVFSPGVNEELAATAVWGTQQVPLLEGARHEGVFALWYGKGPGVDRAGDALKHGNRAGSSPAGGVLVVFGDDHAGKSSTTAHQSEPALAAHGVPVLYPASVQEYLEFGLCGFALSRYSGLWVGFKCVNESIESTATVRLEAAHRPIHLPERTLPPGGVHARLGLDPLGDDLRLQRHRLPLAHAFVRANRLDRELLAPSRGAPRRLGLVAAGKSALDAQEALRLLGLDAARAAELGIGLYKPGLIWPLEPHGLREFARGFEELLVIEEKAAFLEPQVAHALYNLASAERPRLLGKTDLDGAPLVAPDVPLEPRELARLIGARLLPALGGRDEQLAGRIARLAPPPAAAPAPLVRLPYFCSGCPHNTSTRIPEGSLAFSGIGCHAMAVGMQRRTLPPTQMGGEGLTWVGIAPFSRIPHVFQNLGDGTYFHSGLLAIRAAVAAGVNVTYKLLVNDAVAMTGGQPVEGQLTVPELTRQLAAERVRRIAVVTDEPGQYARHAFARGITVHHRDELEALQREFRALPGVTAIVYDQTCAAEKRRRRKRQRLPDPPRRVFINERVCEGCGDCSVQSNCLSVEPVATDFGRKRRIEQSSCNKDYACVRGFCPAFVLVEGARVRARAPAALDATLLAALPEPPVAPLEERAAILITGIGGTGVVMVGAVLAMAAHLEGRAAQVFDMTGLAQKGGAVFGHLKLAPDPQQLGPARLGHEEATVLLGCDLVASAAPEALATIAPGRTQLVLNTHVVPTAQLQREPELACDARELIAPLERAAGAQQVRTLAASRLAAELLGDAIGTNFAVLGCALQLGLLPLSRAALEQAIRLNGVAVELNLRALALGRLVAHAPERLAALLGERSAPEPRAPESLEALLAHRSAHLTAYQDEAYAARYRALVERVRELERARLGSETLACAVARAYAKLLAYKDEYEVARLYTDGTFRAALAAQFERPESVRLLLAPPLLTRRNRRTGEVRKRAFGPWVFRLLRVLAGFKVLRGGPFDLFGYAAERRLERRLIGEYEALIEELLERLAPGNQAIALELASLPESLRGFGHVKRGHLAELEARRAALLERLRAAEPLRPVA